MNWNWSHPHNKSKQITILKKQNNGLLLSYLCTSIMSELKHACLYYSTISEVPLRILEVADNICRSVSNHNVCLQGKGIQQRNKNRSIPMENDTVAWLQLYNDHVGRLTYVIVTYFFQEKNQTNQNKNTIVYIKFYDVNPICKFFF